MKRVLILIVGVIYMTSCNESKPISDESFRKIVIDTLAYERVQQLTKILNYSSLDKGVDSFEIRIWTSLGGTDLNIVEVLKYEDSNWLLSNTRYWLSEVPSFPNRRSKIFLDSADVKAAELSIPFSKLIDTLNSFNLSVFPTQSQIKGFSDNVADGMCYDLEIANKNYYRHFYYHEPEHYRDSFNTKFVSILKAISTKPK